MLVNYDIIKDIIDNWDPIELLHMHSPQDEYDIETRRIYDFLKIQPEETVDFVANCIYDIFVENFGLDIFRKSKCECIEIAEKILSTQHKGTNTVN